MLAAWADTPKVRATSAWLAPWANMRAASRRRSWRPAKSRRQVPTLIGLAAAWRVVALMPPACQHHLRLSSCSAKLFKRQPRCGEVDAMTLTAPVTAIGSTLVTVDRGQAGDWQQALASLGRRLPVGWDASGERSGGVAGYDLILAVPRTLSALAWFLLTAGDDGLADPILQAHHDALTAMAVEFGCAIGAEAPSMVGHAYDSARQPWSHAHLVYGALAATNHGFVPLDPGRVAEQAGRHIFGYQLLVRRAVTELVGVELGLGWAAPAADGSCEVNGLPARVLLVIEGPCRPLSEIGACLDGRERR